MKEISSIVRAYAAINGSNVKAALATVVRVDGSSYRRAGARMLVLENGTYYGGISGGCLEGDALRKAQRAIVQDKPSVVTYDTTQDDEHQVGVGLGCNGIIDVLFTPLRENDPFNPVLLLKQIDGTRVPKAFVTITKGTLALGRSMAYENQTQFLSDFPLQDISPSVLPHIQQGLLAGQSEAVQFDTSAGPVSVFIEIILPAVHLVLYGSNQDIYPMTRMAKELGWMVTIVMNPLKADKSLFTQADKILHPSGHERPLLDAFTAVLLMAHDYKTDLSNLVQVLNSGVSYVGMLGPRKRSQKMFEALAAEGRPVSNENLQRIFTPAGLDIGATTPEEIALSIAAEIRSHFAGREGMSLRLRKTAIHDR